MEGEVGDRLGDEHKPLPVACDAALNGNALPRLEVQVLGRKHLPVAIADSLFERVYLVPDFDDAGYQLVPQNHRGIGVYVGMAGAVNGLVRPTPGTHQYLNHQVPGTTFDAEGLALHCLWTSQINEGFRFIKGHSRSPRSVLAEKRPAGRTTYAFNP